jgi:serine/threonine protein kinase
VCVWYRLRHPNIVLVMGISLVDQEPVALPKSRQQNMSADMYDSANPHLAEGKRAKPQKTVCIITEFLEQGSLADILYGPTKLPAEIWTYELVLTCALQAARGMLYLHSHQPPICHRDLKSSNLVVDDHWVVKVTDFGMSRIVPENVQDRDKGIVSPNTAAAASGHPLGQRKFSLGSSPAGRKFSLGWPSQTSSPLQSTPAAGTKGVGRAAPVPAPAPSPRHEEPDHDLEYPGERASIATVDSALDQHPSLGAESLGAQSHPSLYSKSSHRGGASRLSNFNPEMTSNLGTTAWCAPEVLVSGNRTRYTVKVDVYSFGLVLWELWEKKRPFEELTSRFDIMDAVRAGKRPDISANCPPSFRSLIQRCWQAEPSRRPMFKYIVRYLKDELARVKRQKGGAMYNPSGMRPSGAVRPSGNGADFDGGAHNSSRPRLTAFNIGSPEGDVEPRKSGSNYSGAGGVISDAAEAAAEFFRKSFSFRGSFAGTQQASSPSGNTHRPWTGGNNRDDVYVHSDSAHNVLAALSAAAKRNDDGTLRSSDGGSTTTASARASGAASSGAGGTGSAGTGRASEFSGGARPSEAVPVKVPEGRSPLVTAVTSERSLSYLTESPAPFSHMQAINRQPNRLPGPATAAPKTPVAPTPATKNMNNRWRDRYVMNFSGWAPTNPDSGLPPSMAAPSPHSSPAGPGFGLPPTRPAATTPIPAPAGAPSTDASYNPLNRAATARPGGSATTLSRNNSNVSEHSSVASSPKRPGGAVAAAAAGAAGQRDRDDEMFVLDEDAESKL